MRVHVCHDVAKYTKDEDEALFRILKVGVHTGCVKGRPIKDSPVWPIQRCDKHEEGGTDDPRTIDIAWGNWKSPEDNHDDTLKCSRKEVMEVSVRVVGGGERELDSQYDGKA